MDEGPKFQESKCKHARHGEVDKEESYFSTPFTGKQLTKTFKRTCASLLMIAEVMDQEIEF